MDPAEPLVLPAASAPARRPPLPMLAAVVPVISGIVMWRVTGSLLSLCFAALGPLMLLASFVDGARHRRKDARRLREEADAVWSRTASECAAREEQSRASEHRTHPDAASCILAPPLRPVQVDPGAQVTVGRGSVPTPLRFSGGDDERARAFREAHRHLDDMPVTVPLSGGIAVRGDGPVADAVARALVLQVCLRFATRTVRLSGTGLAELDLGGLPQARTRASDAWHLRVGDGDGREPADTVLMRLPADSDAPAGMATVIDVVDPTAATVRTAAGERTCAVEGISAEQGIEIAGLLDAQADAEPEPPGLLGLADAPTPGDAGGVLRVALGRDARGLALVDLVEDGPHALVTGVTGSGKSELLVSWVTAMAAAYPPERVCFVLADFKGGTAFDPLRELPHVAAVITDLDDGGAERGVMSMRAELRRREAVLAECGARSIAQAADALPRLVLVVDEFAALLQEHPDLAAVFTDIAARGRALGMHLVLGTQRATGVVRDALAANCPLRLSLRVTDPADSRAIIGTDEAAQLPGDLDGRGLALVRRSGDADPMLFRVARTASSDIDAVARRHAGAAKARSPWPPALPIAIRVEELRIRRPDEVPVGALVVGLADEPESQRQTVRALAPGVDRGLAVFGGPGSGKSTVIGALRAQQPDALSIPVDAEAAWSIVSGLADGSIPAPRLLLCDDLDAVLAGFPLDYAQAWAEHMQSVLRRLGTQETSVVITAARSTGQVAAIAGLLAQRAVLRTNGRTEHLAVGGDPGAFDPERRPGRARWGGVEVQFAVADSATDPGRDRLVTDALRTTPNWMPGAALTAVVTPMPARVARALGAEHDAAEVIELAETPPAMPPRTSPGEASPGEESQGGVPRILVADAETWQRHWALWQRVKLDGEVLVLAEAARDLRTLVGIRELAPYARTDAGRAWRVRDGVLRERVVITSLAGGMR
ncbi:hypothetical protein GCM10025768_11690 [Microbacterium pseudoresistens]|uniref:S-DNA-T family DNA segregation ATPase FtsK/SpoIIIE n=1 Tax=Microbacterium pseudoresistens TaxID=640634 RepID=A0A7Y9JMQ3_9MICO|nr:FtsK/SpoIIIE domain-containing protein [Microbacterium pseudoresistens]NYD55072.1 S-DNA-T family DNA segregation ATPase FtsK/SpoIIIE [Microbacterium pseudoresistens]